MNTLAKTGREGVSSTEKRGRLLFQIRVDAGLISVKGTHPTDEETEPLSGMTYCQ